MIEWYVNIRIFAKKRNCKVKVFTQMSNNMKEQIGSPDLLILFTNTVSHKMVNCALQSVDKSKTFIERCHTSSGCALGQILNNYV